MGKKKKEEVVDLKPEKITPEQLSNVQNTVNAVNRSQMELGMLETRKHMMLHDVANIQEKLTTMQAEFEKEYGTFDINIQDGTINYKEDEPSDS
jgi:flagellar motility protein MotE (MotC chaperone)